MLPLDLHVLSLSLAFILSQDQTLHCTFSLNSGRFIVVLTVGLFPSFPFYYILLFLIISKIS